MLTVDKSDILDNSDILDRSDMITNEEVDCQEYFIVELFKSTNYSSHSDLGIGPDKRMHFIYISFFPCRF